MTIVSFAEDAVELFKLTITTATRPTAMRAKQSESFLAIDRLLERLDAARIDFITAPSGREDRTRGAIPQHRDPCDCGEDHRKAHR